MAVNSAAVTVPGRVYVWLGPVGTAAPIDSVVAMGAGWVNVGYTTEDGTRFVPTDPTFEEIRAHQSDWPIRNVQTRDAARIVADLMQLDAPSFTAVMGGGAITQVSAGPPIQYKYTPPTVGGRHNLAACLEAIDGTKHYRWVVPQAFQAEAVELPLEKGSNAQLPLRMTVLGSDAGVSWYLLTDDPAFAIAGAL